MKEEKKCECICHKSEFRGTVIISDDETTIYCVKCARIHFPKPTGEKEKKTVCRYKDCKQNHVKVCNNPACDYLEMQPHLHHEHPSPKASSEVKEEKKKCGKCKVPNLCLTCLIQLDDEMYESTDEKEKSIF